MSRPITKRRRSRTLSLLITALFLAQVVFIAAQLVSMALARHLWLADMANFIRLHLAIGGLGLAVVGLLLPSWWTRLGAVAAAGAAMLPFFMLPASAPYLGGVQINVVSANVMVDNYDPSQFIAFSDVREADLLVLQEMKPLWQTALIETGIWAYESSRNMRATTDMKVFSRFPVLSETVISPQSTDTGGRHPLRMELDVEGRTLIVYAVHAQTPRSPAMWRERTAYLRDLVAAIQDERSDAAVMVSGDWNTPTFSPFYKDVLAATGYLRAESRWWPLATRFSVRFGSIPQLGVPIDQIALSPHVGVENVRTSAIFGSNHVAIFARLTLP